MNKLVIFLAAVLSFLPGSVGGAQTAQTRLYCLSLKFQQGRSESAYYSLNLTTLNAGINGELAPTFTSPTHFSYLEVTDELFGGYLGGYLEMNVPSGGDANRNGWPDFFEVAQPVSATSAGNYTIPGLGSGTVQASWGRAAGESVGTCILKFKPNTYYTWETFTHTFELLEYTGPLTYTPASNTVPATVALQRTGNDTILLGGLASFVKVATDRFNKLTLQTGSWTNEVQQELLFTANLLDRDPEYPTNYYGYFDFADGDPNTADPDYATWVLSIDDLNDADHDGIPDFSDDPAAVSPPRSPRLSLAPGVTNLWLTISGTVGATSHIQSTTNLASPDWQPVLTVKLTNDPQTVSLPRPVCDASFWRVVAE